MQVKKEKKMYIGEFYKDKKHGYGIYKTENNKIFCGTWYKGK
jgi:hypothetical protein